MGHFPKTGAADEGNLETAQSASFILFGDSVDSRSAWKKCKETVAKSGQLLAVKLNYNLNMVSHKIISNYKSNTNYETGKSWNSL